MKKVLVYTAIATLFIGCGSSSSSKENGSIDMVKYFPIEEVSNTYIYTKSSGHRSQTKEDISINGDIITVKVDNKTVKTITKGEKSIIVKDIENNTTKTYKRFVNVGSTLYTLSTSATNEEIVFEGIVMGTKSTDSTKTCKLKSEKDKLDKSSYIYNGDILEFRCIENKSIVTHVRDDLPEYIELEEGTEKTDDDISYFYMQKDIGLIAEINDDCIVEDSEGKKVIKDSSTNCSEKEYIYKFMF